MPLFGADDKKFFQKFSSLFLPPKTLKKLPTKVARPPVFSQEVFAL